MGLHLTIDGWRKKRHKNGWRKDLRASWSHVRNEIQYMNMDSGVLRRQ